MGLSCIQCSQQLLVISFTPVNARFSVLVCCWCVAPLLTLYGFPDNVFPSLQSSIIRELGVLEYVTCF